MVYNEYGEKNQRVFIETCSNPCDSYLLVNLESNSNNIVHIDLTFQNNIVHFISVTYYYVPIYTLQKKLIEVHFSICLTEMKLKRKINVRWSIKQFIKVRVVRYLE